MKSNKVIFYVLTVVALLFYSCSPKLGFSWKDPIYQSKDFSKIAVVSISEDLSARNAFEGYAVQLLRDKGVNAIAGITIFPQNPSSKEENESVYIKILKDNNVDGVITMSLLNVKESQRYVQEETYYDSVDIKQFGNYYSRTYGLITAPGYYEYVDSYLIEAVLYDVNRDLKESDNSMVWLGHSTLVNPSSLQDAAVTFTERMVGTLVNDGVITTIAKEKVGN